MLFNGKLYKASVEQHYTAKAGKSGRTKKP
jgi:hypothetical protein